MYIKYIIFSILVLVTCGCAYYVKNQSFNDPAKEEFTEQVFQKLSDIAKVEAYPASKKYKLIRENNDASITPKFPVDQETKIRLLELLKDKENYQWNVHKKTIFTPTIGYKLYTSKGERIDAVFSFQSRQIRYSQEGTFVVLECDAIAPEMKRIADRILDVQDTRSTIEFQ